MYDPTCPNCDEYRQAIALLEQERDELLRAKTAVKSVSPDTPMKALPLQSELQQMNYQISLLEKNLNKSKVENLNLRLQVEQLESENHFSSKVTLEKEIVNLKKIVSEREKTINQLNSKIVSLNKPVAVKQEKEDFTHVLRENSYLNENYSKYRRKYYKYKSKYEELKGNVDYIMKLAESRPITVLPQEKKEESEIEEEEVYEYDFEKDLEEEFKEAENTLLSKKKPKKTEEPEIVPEIKEELKVSKPEKEEETAFQKVMRERLEAIKAKKQTIPIIIPENHQKPNKMQSKTRAAKKKKAELLSKLLTQPVSEQSETENILTELNISPFELFNEFLSQAKTDQLELKHSLNWLHTLFSGDSVLNKYTFLTDILKEHALFKKIPGSLTVDSATDLTQDLKITGKSVKMSAFPFYLLSYLSKTDSNWYLASLELFFSFIYENTVTKANYQIFLTNTESLEISYESLSSSFSFGSSPTLSTLSKMSSKPTPFAKFITSSIFLKKPLAGPVLLNMIQERVQANEEQSLCSIQMVEVHQILSYLSVSRLIDTHLGGLVVELFNIFASSPYSVQLAALYTIGTAFLLVLDRLDVFGETAQQIYSWIRCFLNPTKEFLSSVTDDFRAIALYSLVDCVPQDPLLLPLLVDNNKKIQTSLLPSEVIVKIEKLVAK